PPGGHEEEEFVPRLFNAAADLLAEKRRLEGEFFSTVQSGDSFGERFLLLLDDEHVTSRKTAEAEAKFGLHSTRGASANAGHKGGLVLVLEGDDYVQMVAGTMRKMLAEAAKGDFLRSRLAIPPLERTLDDGKALAELSSTCTWLSRLDHKLQLELLMSATLRTMEEGELLAVQGEPARSFFMVLQGGLEARTVPATEVVAMQRQVGRLREKHQAGQALLLSSNSSSERAEVCGETLVAAYRPGDSLGENCLAHGGTRMATVVAGEAGALMEITKAMYDQCILKVQSEELRGKVQALRSIPAMHSWSSSQFVQAAALFYMQTFRRDEVVLLQDDPVSDIHVIVRGCLRVTRRVLAPLPGPQRPHKPATKSPPDAAMKTNRVKGVPSQIEGEGWKTMDLLTLGEGQYCGDIAAFEDCSQPSSVQVISAMAELCSVSGPRFISGIASFTGGEEALQKMRALSEERCGPGAPQLPGIRTESNEARGTGHARRIGQPPPRDTQDLAAAPIPPRCPPCVHVT
ncbi:hypothetical protein CYMTET_24489, partial [Cymbomonas tetramitiformis]